MYRMEFRKHWASQTARPHVAKFDGGFRVNVVPTEATALVLGMAPDDLARAAAPLCAELGVRCRVEADGVYARITVAGVGCHAASPELGNNGNTALVRVLSELPLADCPSTRALRELNGVLPHGDYTGKNLGIAQEDAISQELTCSFTQLNFDEHGLWGLCDMRVPVCADKKNCQDVAEAKMSALGYEMSGHMIPPHYTPADTPFIAKLLRSWEMYTGKPGTCYSMGGGTYVHDVPGGVAFGVEMPGFETNMHGANEHARLEDLLTSVEIYAQAIADICGEDA
jgi:Acetylornithine deacetylase/Succinyl-diaminopimelate desuccinylase and related deacylases